MPLCYTSLEISENAYINQVYLEFGEDKRWENSLFICLVRVRLI